MNLQNKAVSYNHNFHHYSSYTCISPADFSLLTYLSRSISMNTFCLDKDLNSHKAKPIRMCKLKRWQKTVYEKPKPQYTLGCGGTLHTEVTQNVSCSQNRKTGKLSNCLGRKCETRSDPLKGNQSQARMYPIGLKGREVEREKRNEDLANRSSVLAVGTCRLRNVTVTLSNRLWQEPDIYLRKKSCRIQLSAEPGWHWFADAIF